MMNRIIKTALLSMIVALVPLTSSHAADSYAAELTSITGQVWVRQGNSKAEQRVSSPTKLLAGSRIRTGADASAELSFSDGSILHLKADSSMKLSAYERQLNRKSSVMLFFGQLWTKIRSQTNPKAGEKFTVHTANVACGVRGTEFAVAVGDDGSMRIRVGGGQVWVHNDRRNAKLGAGTELQADERGLSETRSSTPKPRWRVWRQAKLRRLGKEAGAIVYATRSSVERRRQRLEDLRAEQDRVMRERQLITDRLSMGDPRAQSELAANSRKLAQLADQLADEGDGAHAQFGTIDRLSALAADPRFQMLDRATIKRELASLTRVRKSLDRLVNEGMKVSMQDMGEMIEDMQGGKSTLKEKKGSTRDELFGPGGLEDEFDRMKP